MKINKFVFLFLIVFLIVLGSALFTEIANVNSLTLPYRVGSPIIPSSQLPVGMTLKTFNVAQSEPVPTVAFDINQDSMGAWEVHVTTTNFTFAPQHINGAPVPGEGHVHLYIDNNLIIMLGPWFRLDSLTPGTHTIKVGLFNNDHSVYSVNGSYIEASKNITVR